MALHDNDMQNLDLGRISNLVDAMHDKGVRLTESDIEKELQGAIHGARLDSILRLWTTIRDNMQDGYLANDITKGNLAILVHLASDRHGKYIAELTVEELSEVLSDLLVWVESKEAVLRISLSHMGSPCSSCDILSTWHEELSNLADSALNMWIRTDEMERIEEQQDQIWQKGDAPQPADNQKATAHPYRFAALGALLVTAPIVAASAFIFLPLIMAIAASVSLAGGIALAERLTKPTWKRTYALVQEAHAATLASHLNTVDAHISNNSANAAALLKYGTDTEEYYKERVNFMLTQAVAISTTYEQVQQGVDGETVPVMPRIAEAASVAPVDSNQPQRVAETY